MTQNTFVSIAENAEKHLPKRGGRKAISIELKKLRSSLGLTQKGFAERFGIPIASIRNWESEARTSNPDATALLLIDMIKADASAAENLVRKAKGDKHAELC